jgi:hypothetical protein
MSTDRATDHTRAFGIPINKDVVRRILAARYHPKPDSAEPSWLTVLGHAKDSLWSLDLFRCESAVLHTYWVLVVMDQCTRRIPRGAGRADAGTAHRRGQRPSECQYVSLAAPLSWAVSDADRSMTA